MLESSSLEDDQSSPQGSKCICLEPCGRSMHETSSDARAKQKAFRVCSEHFTKHLDEDMGTSHMEKGKKGGCMCVCTHGGLVCMLALASDLNSYSAAW